jgi:hypothetical protein
MPHPTMLLHLVQVFFECFSRNFPFLQYDDISRRVFNGTLSPLLANSIASLAARYSQSSDVMTRGATAVSNAYAEAAKVGYVPPSFKCHFELTRRALSLSQRLLHDSSHVPYIEILHAVIVLAWAEYKCGRVAGPTEYSQVRAWAPVRPRLYKSMAKINCLRLGGRSTDGNQTRHESGTR